MSLSAVLKCLSDEAGVTPAVVVFVIHDSLEEDLSAQVSKNCRSLVFHVRAGPLDISPVV